MIDDVMMMIMMIGITGAFVEVLTKPSMEFFQGWTDDQVWGRLFHSPALLWKNECL